MVFNLRGGFVSPLPQAASPHAEVDLLSDLEGFPFCAAGEPSFLSSLSPALPLSSLRVWKTLILVYLPRSGPSSEDAANLCASLSSGRRTLLASCFRLNFRI